MTIHHVQVIDGLIIVTYREGNDSAVAATKGNARFPNEATLEQLETISDYLSVLQDNEIKRLKWNDSSR